MESHKRSIAKALSWRMIAVVITTVIAYLFTHEAVLSLSIGVVDLVIKLFTYYAHERLWNRFDFGRVKAAEEDYNI